jgi:hypothetical protein
MIMDDTPRRRVRSGRIWRSALAAAPLLLAAQAARAQTNSALLVAPFPKEQAVVAEADALFLENGHIAETEVDEEFQLSVYNSFGRIRVIPGEERSPRVGYNFTYLDLSTGFDPLPDRLVDQSVAVGFPVAQVEDWIFGASLGVGYAGDGGFGDGDAWYGLGSFVAFRQLSENSGFAIFLDYDGNRTFLPDVPLPGFVYLRRIQDRLSMTLGVPISSIRWEPTEQLTVELALLIPDNLRVDVGYEVVEDVVAFGRLRQQAEGFFVDGLPENHDRILFEQRRAEAGVRYAPTDAVNVDLAVGYAWGGEFSEGFDVRETDEIADVSDEPYVRAGVQLRF